MCYCIYLSLYYLKYVLILPFHFINEKTAVPNNLVHCWSQQPIPVRLHFESKFLWLCSLCSESLVILLNTRFPLCCFKIVLEKSHFHCDVSHCANARSLIRIVFKSSDRVSTKCCKLATGFQWSHCKLWKEEVVNNLFLRLGNPLASCVDINDAVPFRCFRTCGKNRIIIHFLCQLLLIFLSSTYTTFIR